MIEVVGDRVLNLVELGTTCVRHVFDMCSTCVILVVRRVVLRFTTALLFELMDSQIIINGYPNNGKNGLFLGYTKINYGISKKVFAVTFGQKF